MDTQEKDSSMPRCKIIYINFKPNTLSKRVSEIIALELERVTRNIKGTESNDFFTNLPAKFNPELNTIPGRIIMENNLNRGSLDDSLKSILDIDEGIDAESTPVNKSEFCFGSKNNQQIAFVKVYPEKEVFKLVGCFLAIQKKGDNSDDQQYSLKYMEQTFIMETTSTILNIKPKNDLVYDNCDPISTILSQNVNTIANYAINAMGINTSLDSPSQIYDNCCNCLNSRLGSSEPYYMRKELNEEENHLIIEDLKEILPGSIRSSYINRAMNIIQSNLYGTNDQPSMSKSQTTMDQHGSNIITNDEFEMIKIKQEGDNIVIIPSYCKVEKSRQIESGYIYNKISHKYSLEYKQQKFILSKFDIEMIVNKIESK